MANDDKNRFAMISAVINQQPTALKTAFADQIRDKLAEIVDRKREEVKAAFNNAKDSNDDNQHDDSEADPDDFENDEDVDFDYDTDDAGEDGFEDDEQYDDQSDEDELEVEDDDAKEA